MTDLAFLPHFEAPIVAGDKFLTLRREWKNGLTPDIDQSLRLVVSPRTPQRRVFATAKVEFRATLGFTPDLLATLHHWRQAPWSGPNAQRVHTLLTDAVRLIPRSPDNLRRHGLQRAHDCSAAFAALDGFPSFEAFYSFHNSHRPEGSPRRITREVIGLGLVTPEFAPAADAAKY